MADGLLLLHAWPLDGSMWDGQVGRLAGRIPVAAPSFPGFGGTPSAGAVMTMSAAAAAAIGAADDAGLDRFVACGISMGGYVAFALWRRYRARVIGLVLANTRAGADDDTGRERRRGMAERLRAEGSGFLVDQPPPLLSDGAPPELWERVLGMVRAQPAEAIAAATLGMAERADSTPDLPGIDVPTLVVASSGDRLIPPSETTPLAQAIPQATLTMLEGAGHLSNLEAPEPFDAALLEHLRRCGLPA